MTKIPLLAPYRAVQKDYSLMGYLPSLYVENGLLVTFNETTGKR